MSWGLSFLWPQESWQCTLWVPRTLRRNLPRSDQNLQKIVFFIPFSENNLIKTNFTPAEKLPQQNHSPESSVDDRGLDLLLDMCSPHCLFSACFIFFSPQLQNYDLSSGLSNLEEFLVFFPLSSSGVVWMRMLLIDSCICMLTPKLVNNLRRVGHMVLLEMCHWGWTWRFQKSHTRLNLSAWAFRSGCKSLRYCSTAMPVCFLPWWKRTDPLKR